MRHNLPTILFILHLPPPVHGAAMVGKFIYDSETLNRAFDCHFINLATAKDLSDIGKGGIKKTFKFFSLLCNVFRSVRQLHPSVVYITPNACGGAFYKDFMVVMLLKIMGQKVIAHYHNKGVRSRQNQWFDNLLYKRFFKHLKLILLAESLYPDFQKYVERKDVYICPNGLPASYVTDHQVFNLKSPHSPSLLFLSNLIISKGVTDLLDACQILKEKKLDFTCSFVGGETAEMDNQLFLREVEKRQLKDIVTYDGKKYGKEKDAAFNQADIFVFPTYYPNECFPIVLLEAMQHHLPCISTNEGAIADIIDHGKTGLLVTKNAPQQLAKAIQSLLENPDKRKWMGDNGFKKYQQKFLLSNFETTLLNILTQEVENSLQTKEQ